MLLLLSIQPRTRNEEKPPSKGLMNEKDEKSYYQLLCVFLTWSTCPLFSFILYLCIYGFALGNKTVGARGRRTGQEGEMERMNVYLERRKEVDEEKGDEKQIWIDAQHVQLVARNGLLILWEIRELGLEMYL